MICNRITHLSLHLKAYLTQKIAKKNKENPKINSTYFVSSLHA